MIVTTRIKNVYAERRKSLGELGYSSYEDYLSSGVWQEIRRKVLRRDRGRCRLCGSRAFAVHHTSYSTQVLAGGDLSKLLSICNRCHAEIEFDDGRKLSEAKDIARKAREIARSNGRTVGIENNKRNRSRAKCRCCRKMKKQLGRQNICLQCYRKHRTSVHAIANRNSGKLH